MNVTITLDKALEKAHMTQKQLSTATGIRAASIHEMFYNKTERFPLKNLALICEVLDCQITDILKLEKEQTD